MDRQLPLTTLTNTTRVRMANGAVEFIQQVADLSPIIVFAGVPKSATQALFGLGPLMDKGFEVISPKLGLALSYRTNLSTRDESYNRVYLIYTVYRSTF